MRKLLFICFLKMLFISQLALAQQTITGTVTSAADGTPLPGVNITVQGTTTGTVSDVNGNYSITVVDSEATLVFSFIGYISFETVVGDRFTLDVTLEEGSEYLDEIVVIGYGETQRKAFTGSLTSVDVTEIANVPQQSAVSLMQGKAAGVLVTETDGQPGSVASTLIRGLGSFRGSPPLYVIDGIPASNFNSFNPSDIQSISVLKDAAATSIYGSRAAAGVILITTKKGKAGKTKFDFSAQYGTTSIENPKDFRLLNAEEYLEYYREAAINGGLNPDDVSAGSYYLPLGGDYYDTDWYDEVTRTGAVQSYELSASGGSEKTTFYISFGHFNETGVVIGTDFKRTTGRANFTHNVNDKLNFDLRAFGSVNHENYVDGTGRSGNFSGHYNTSPLESPYADENTPLQYNGLGYNFDIPSNANHNPVASARINENWFDEYRAFPSLRINYSPIQNLKLWGSVSYDFRYYKSKESMSKYLLAETQGGETEQQWEQNLTSNYNAIAEYTYDINDSHTVKVLAGAESFKYEGESSEAGSQTFGTDAINNFAAGQSTSVGQLDYDYYGNTLVSIFTRADYTFKNKLFVHGSYRRDGSSRFGEGNRWGNFYAFGAGYTLSEESFIQNIPQISNLKIKASYGITGNPNSGDFEWRNTYGPGGAYNLPGAANPGSVIDNPGNPNLKWEQSGQTNIGLDFGLFNDRISGTVEYYDIRSIDLITNRPISMTSGYTDIIDNVAEIKNNGVEVSLSSVNVQSGDFTWTTSINFTKNNNEVVSLAGASDTLILSSRVAHIKGQPAYQWYTPSYAGVDPATGAQMYYTETGETTYDYNNAEIKVQGTSPIVAPKYYGGITNTVSYKGFALSFLIYYKYGGKIYRDLLNDLSLNGGASGASNQASSEMDYWKQPGDITDIPKLDVNYVDPGPTDRWLEDASYIRLRNVSLSYTIPSKYTTRFGVNNLAVYVRGVNLLTFTAYKGLNVTVGDTESNGDYPTPRTITFGINASF